MVRQNPLPYSVKKSPYRLEGQLWKYAAPVAAMPPPQKNAAFLKKGGTQKILLFLRHLLPVAGFSIPA
ncbi:hypothetical protein [Komagataeibacter xylinus]|uniref:Uncharacterized protein n=1 Tax=Komagataeibacter xylinus TaxID=28448 RepID=A0A857FLR5_KOMXY|nr:hypothetical protein [Komagataeibacter xylinus]QHC34197.1 hypothetical protein FMA36_00505 [Komagataeibacter xylinus]